MAADRKAAARGRSAAERRPAPASPAQTVRGFLADAGAGEFNRLVYERVRLGMMSALAVNRSLSFTELKELLEASDGNLSVHARKLEEAGYVSCKKTFDGRLPRTEYRLTARGRRALERYLDHMEALIRATRDG